MFISVCRQYQQKQHSECGTGSTETMWSIDKPTLHVPKKHQGEFARWTVLKRVPPMTDTYLLGHWRLAEGQWEWRWWLEWGTKAGSWFSTLWTIFASPWSHTQRHKASEKKTADLSEQNVCPFPSTNPPKQYIGVLLVIVVTTTKPYVENKIRFFFRAKLGLLLHFPLSPALRLKVYGRSAKYRRQFDCSESRARSLEGGRRHEPLNRD